MLHLPQTASEFIVLAVPLFTLALGISFLLLPGILLGKLGLQALPDVPEAIGEGRSSFAGFLLGISLSCLLFQHPIAQQPGLTFMLAACWLLAGVGKTIQISVDGSRRKRDILYAIVAFTLGGAALWVAEPAHAAPQFPQSRSEFLIAVPALVTACFGFYCLALPRRALAILRLQPVAGREEAKGEPRGILGGFLFSVGLASLLGFGIFAALVLAMCWGCTALGRLISILSDRGKTIFNGLSLLFDTVMATLPVLVIFNLAG